MNHVLGDTQDFIVTVQFDYLKLRTCKVNLSHAFSHF